MGPLSTLLKIQELELVLKESAIVHPDKELDTKALQNEICKLKQQIPDKFVKNYERVKKNGIGIAQEIQGRCKACHMAIPTGTISRIANGNAEPICPSCRIYIFLEQFNEEN
jgi:predicted  nucleic acid-binding Zn-ribbon protein